MRFNFYKFKARLVAFRADRRGAVYIFTAFCILGMLGLAGLAIDMSYFYVARNQLQTSADAAALAGASVMSNATAMQAEAKKYAQMNIAGDDQILANADIQRGTWDYASHTFTPGGGKPNSVRVTTRMAQANGNPAGTFFARILGFDNVDISTSAVAAYGTDKEWDVLVVQDVTSSFSAEIGNARAANHALLDCLQQRTSGDSLVGMVTYTGVAQDYVALDSMDVGYDNLSSAIDGLDSCGSTGMPACSGTHVGAGMQRALGMFADADADEPDRNRGIGRAMVILGDGAPNASGPNAGMSNQDLINHAISMADQAEANDISVYTVFYDESNDDAGAAFFEDLVRGKGTALRTPDSAQLPTLFESLCSSLPLRLVQ
jgi:Flp pilus assembly protein TadG